MNITASCKSDAKPNTQGIAAADYPQGTFMARRRLGAQRDKLCVYVRTTGIGDKPCWLGIIGADIGYKTSKLVSQVYRKVEEADFNVTKSVGV